MKAFIAPAIFDGHRRHAEHALLESNGFVTGIVPVDAVPAEAEQIILKTGLIAPGFVDLQVNGGGGILFNNDVSVEAIATIAKAHRRFGTTALLPTLITDSWENTLGALRAVDAAMASGGVRTSRNSCVLQRSPMLSSLPPRRSARC
jgi:N-acetylglucosamine-6-phosphate deacetylase